LSLRYSIDICLYNLVIRDRDADRALYIADTQHHTLIIRAFNRLIEFSRLID
jgi:hypothetical protein